MMKNTMKIFLLLVFAGAFLFSCSNQSVPLEPGSEYTLVWSDEFSASTLDTNEWNYDTGNGDWGWGNNEKEYYTSRPENVKIENGSLVITAREESYAWDTFNYTSGRINTRDKAYFKYGRFDVMIKLPKGQGMWPAFWMLPQTATNGPWPYSGEIDIMELVGNKPDVVYGTVHYHDYNHASSGGSVALASGDFADDYHQFTVVWDEEYIRWYMDGEQYFEFFKGNPIEGRRPFDYQFYLILNLAVGGEWPGNPDSSTSFPQTMEVDWVRVYQKI